MPFSLKVVDRYFDEINGLSIQIAFCFMVLKKIKYLGTIKA